MTSRRTPDAIWADILNGAVICALGVVLPVGWIWLLVQGGGEASRFGLIGWIKLASVVFVGFWSLKLAQAGLRLLRKSVTEVRNRAASGDSAQ